MITAPQNKIHNQVTKQKIKAKVFDIAEMERRRNNSHSKSNVHQNMRLYLSYLNQTDGNIELIGVNRDVLTRLMRLVLNFPNFKAVIEHYVQQMALQLLNETPYFSSDPVLIIGDAGIGKTAFCQALSTVIGTPYEVLAMSTATAGFVLSGMSPSWSEGKPGKVVESLARNRVANPLLMLDEIDKASGDARYDPIGSLYQLLENDTARNFMDEGLEITADCSYINWLATANEQQLIPAPILSRFTVFHVNSPTKDDMRKVISSIYKKIIQQNEWGRFYDKELPVCAVDKIIESSIEPRTIQKAIKTSCSKIALDYVLNKRKTKRPFRVSADYFSINEEPWKRSIGF